MSIDIKAFLELEKLCQQNEKKRLNLLRDKEVQHVASNEDHRKVSSDTEHYQQIDVVGCGIETETGDPNSPVLSCRLDSPPSTEQKLPLVERLDLASKLEKEKQAFIDKRANSENPLVRSKSSPKSVFIDVRPVTAGLSKAVQTDIKNIHNKLVQYELQSQDPAEKELSPQPGRGLTDRYTMHSNRSPISRVDQRLTSAQNAMLKAEMEKPRSILSSRRSGSPRERLPYVPSFMDGFSYQEDKSQLHERERLKREAYQAELRHQIEEKKRLAAMREDQERREQELENRRLEQQLLRMQEEEYAEEQRRLKRDEQLRRNSEDFIRRKHELQSRTGYRKHTDSESSVSTIRNSAAAVASKQLSHYSPPVSRRNPYSFNIPSSSVFADPTSRYNSNRFDTFNRRDALNRMDSISTFDTHSKYNNDAFSRYDSLSRIDTLNRQDPLSRLETLSIKDNFNKVQRRHSATQQDLSFSRRSPKLQRRSSSSKFDDTLPIPVLKAHSPVAKELKNSIAINSSRHSSDAVRKLEDKWQIPAVQRNIINHADGQNRSILTQLGAIRMQLQQEQMRMDETLRKRGISQSKAVDFH